VIEHTCRLLHFYTFTLNRIVPALERTSAINTNRLEAAKYSFFFFCLLFIVIFVYLFIFSINHLFIFYLLFLIFISFFFLYKMVIVSCVNLHTKLFG
jgi:hypothetical protein